MSSAIRNVAGDALMLRGDRESGQDTRTANVTAAAAVANIVKTSLGPVGLDKMLVDDVGDVTISNDGATILKLLEVEHPAAKVLVELADLQDQEVGDGTTSVVIVAAELLKRANALVKQGIHPTSIISGYRLAVREAVKYVQERQGLKVSDLGTEALINAAKTSMSSKIIGNESEFFAKMCVDAIQSVKSFNDMGDVRYSVKAINILKAHGKSSRDSLLLDGFALNCRRGSQQMPTSIKNAKIALIDFQLNRLRLPMGVQVLVEDVNKIEDIRKREQDITKERIAKILGSGANVLLNTKGIDDMAMKYFVEAGCIAVRHCSKDDLKRIAKATGGKIMATMADMEGNESFESDNLGEAAEVCEERVADDSLIMIKGCKTTKAKSILLRGANEHMLDEMERSVHDALCVVKRVLESNKVVPGGGAVEAALSIYLEQFSTTLGSREQLAIAQFAEALLVIPKTLAVNAAKDATDLVAKLRAYHNASQTNTEKQEYSRYGLDLVSGMVRDNVAFGVLEPMMSKIKSLQFACEAAITILRIDDVIRLEPKQNQEQGH